VRAAGGEIVGLTAAPQSQADTAAREWRIQFPLVSDPYCELVTAMNRNGWITSVVVMDDSVTSSDSFFVKNTGSQYSTGMLQPGVVALQGPVDVYTEKCKGGAGIDSSVLLSWGSVPSLDNINGAGGRLPPKEAWRAVQASLAGDYSLANPDSKKLAKVSVHPYVLFFLLMANGNFIEPKTFTNNVMNGHGAYEKMKGAAAKALFAFGVLGIGVGKAPLLTSTALAAYFSYFFLSPSGPWKILSDTFEQSAISKL